MGTLLFPYFEFNDYFFKIFVIHIFWANLAPKSEVPQIKWNLVQGTLLYVYYNFNVHFSKIFVTHVFWVNLEP